MKGIFTGIGIVLDVLMTKILESNSQKGKLKGHSLAWYQYVENNGCPPPSFYDYKLFP